MKILITGGTSATALKLLKAFKDYEVVLADYGGVPKFSSSSYTLISLGERNDDIIAHSLLNNCLDNEIEMILPLSSFEIEAVAKSEVLFNEFNIEVLLPSMDDLKLYFKQKNNQKSTDWIVFLKGNVLFTNTENELVIAFGQKEKLSGAYCFNGTNLNLIVI